MAVHNWPGVLKGQQGLGPIAVELCCIFDRVSRAPLRFVYGESATSEHKLIKKLIECLRENDLLFLDTGFYYFATFARNLPAALTQSPSWTHLANLVIFISFQYLK